MQQRLGKDAAESIDGSKPRLVCVAGDFTRYDEHAVLQINRSIELGRYRGYGATLLVLELLTSTEAKATAAGAATDGAPVTKAPTSKTGSRLHAQASQELNDLFDSLEQRLVGLGDDVVKSHPGLIRLPSPKNFACVEVHPQSKKLLLFVKVAMDEVTLEPGFTREVTNVGHFGTGNLEITVDSADDLERADSLITGSYEGNWVRSRADRADPRRGRNASHLLRPIQDGPAKDQRGSQTPPSRSPPGQAACRDMRLTNTQRR